MVVRAMRVALDRRCCDRRGLLLIICTTSVVLLSFNCFNVTIFFFFFNCFFVKVVFFFFGGKHDCLFTNQIVEIGVKLKRRLAQHFIHAAVNHNCPLNERVARVEVVFDRIEFCVVAIVLATRAARKREAKRIKLIKHCLFGFL